MHFLNSSQRTFGLDDILLWSIADNKQVEKLYKENEEEWNLLFRDVRTKMKKTEKKIANLENDIIEGMMQ